MQTGTILCLFLRFAQLVNASYIIIGCSKIGHEVLKVSGTCVYMFRNLLELCVHSLVLAEDRRTEDDGSIRSNVGAKNPLVPCAAQL